MTETLELFPEGSNQPPVITSPRIDITNPQPTNPTNQSNQSNKPPTNQSNQPASLRIDIIYINRHLMHVGNIIVTIIIIIIAVQS